MHHFTNDNARNAQTTTLHTIPGQTETIQEAQEAKIPQSTWESAFTQEQPYTKLWGGKWLSLHLLALSTVDLIREIHLRAQDLPFVELDCQGLANLPVDPSESCDAIDPEADQSLGTILTGKGPWKQRRTENWRSLHEMADLEIIRINGRWSVRCTRLPIPKVNLRQLAEEYEFAMKACGGDTQARVWVKKDHRNAWELAKAINARFNTMERVAQAILELQPAFFTDGFEGLRLLDNKQVALHLGVDETTVSRAVKNKYINTPLGTWPLERLLPKSVTTLSGKQIPMQHFHARLFTLVKEEDPRQPHSDRQLMLLLAKEGVDLPLRTVTAHRHQLRIANSRDRRRETEPNAECSLAS